MNTTDTPKRIRCFTDWNKVRVGLLGCGLSGFCLFATPPSLTSSGRSNGFDLYARPPAPVQTTPTGDATVALPKVAPDGKGIWPLDFVRLGSFNYDTIPQDESVSGSCEGIPPEVVEWNGRRVSIHGYMLPILLNKGLTTDFLIMRDQSTCCYGITPTPTAWIVARVKTDAVKSQMDTPLMFTGTFHVGAEFEGGMFAGIYKMEVENVVAP